MKVGVARLSLGIPGAETLKDRRRVTRSFRDRVRARGSVSIAELSPGEDPRLARFGVAVVAGDSAEADLLLSRVIEEARRLPDAVLLDVGTEVLAFGRSGEGLAARVLREEPQPGEAWPPAVDPRAGRR